MNFDILVFIITHILSFTIMTILVLTLLKRPFTLADVLFFPDDDSVKSFDDVETAQFFSIAKWIPFVNIIICCVFIFLCILCIIMISFSWLYNKTKKIFDKIVFK